MSVLVAPAPVLVSLERPSLRTDGRLSTSAVTTVAGTVAAGAAYVGGVYAGAGTCIPCIAGNVGLCYATEWAVAKAKNRSKVAWVDG